MINHVTIFVTTPSVKKHLDLNFFKWRYDPKSTSIGSARIYFAVRALKLCIIKIFIYSLGLVYVNTVKYMYNKFYWNLQDKTLGQKF